VSFFDFECASQNSRTRAFFSVPVVLLLDQFMDTMREKGAQSNKKIRFGAVKSGRGRKKERKRESERKGGVDMF